MEFEEEVKILKLLRIFTTALIIIPPLLFLGIFFEVEAVCLGLFCLTLLPLSLLLIILQFIIKRLRRKTKGEIKVLDDFKIFYAICGMLIGIFLWMIIYVVTG
ncbi:MAG: hypothetical protein K1X55_05950 [Chitinophagales bacterium]|nr:hypothetical protein [Chitinophagales bacterium]